MFRKTWMEVNLDEIADNVRKIREISKKKFIAVLKADAYGCGDIQVCRAVEEAGADIVMCDNMPPTEVRRVVALRDERYPHIALEASGNITLDNIAAYAQSGIDALSIGALIHQARWLDVSLKMQFNA